MRLWRRTMLTMAFLALWLCALPSSLVLHAQSVARADSVVYARTSNGGCVVVCRSYMLTLRASGAVSFTSWTTSSPRRTTRHAAGSNALARVERAARAVAFDGLPEITMGDAPLCSPVASDAESIVITVHARPETRTVDYYTGCFGGREYIRRLRTLADSIDTVVGVARLRGTQ